MDPRIKTVLEYAIMAPSGDNCQPWKFTVDGLKVHLFNDPDLDRSLYNLKQRASLISHGALLENISLSTPAVGLQCRIELLPDPDNEEQIATIYFYEGKKGQTDLFRAIPQRHTNREKYLPVKIYDTQVKGWQKLPQRTGEKIWVGCAQEQIRHLADLLSMNDRLVFEVPALHQFLFEQIRWTKNEAKVTGDGLDIRTLGLNAIDRLSFRFLKHWKLVAGLNKFGLSGLIQMKAKQLTNSSSAIAIVTIPDTETVDYVEGGKLWQRLLLQLANEGLTAQPVAGLACLLQNAHEGFLDRGTTDNQRTHLLRTRSELMKYIGVHDSSVILAMFRIGQGPPVTRALRRPLSHFLLS